MDYNTVCEMIDKLDVESGEMLDCFIAAAVAGNYFTEALPERAQSAAVLLDWFISGKNASEMSDSFDGVSDFYRICPTEASKPLLKLLNADGGAEIAELISSGIKGLKKAKRNEDLFCGWAEDVQEDFAVWAETGAPSLHRIVARWIKADAAELKEYFANTEVTFVEACMNHAGFLRAHRENGDAFKLFMFAAEAGNAEAMFDISEYYAFIEEDKEKAFDWCKKAAEGGSANAQLRLACMCADKGDKKAAFEWCKKAADKGQAGAMLMLGRIYKDGDGAEKDMRLAVEYLQKAADGGMPDAFRELAPLYDAGDGTERDVMRAIEYYSIAAILGSPTAQERLKRFPDMPDYAARSEELQRLAKGGDVRAVYALGCLAEYREDEAESEKYYEKAAKLWREKADAGDPEAMVFLGLCYNWGKGVEEDQAEAFGLYERAEGLGYARASFCLGELYSHGEGVKYSPKTANKYYLKAAEAGVADAMLDLGRNYDDGNGIKKDKDKAVYWLTRAANEGNDTCAHRCLAFIADERHEKETAREWRAKAAEKGDRTAQIWLARNVLEDDPDLAELVERKSRHYEYTEFYDEIFEMIKDGLPFRNDRITLVK